MGKSVTTSVLPHADPDRSRSASGRRVARLSTFAVAMTAAFGFIAFYQPPRPLLRVPFTRESGSLAVAMPHAELSAGAFGRSGALHVRFALPGQKVGYPLEVTGDPTALYYVWQRVADSALVDAPRTLGGDTLIAPMQAGFYHLAVVRDGLRRVIDSLTLAVLVPFEQKHGPVLDGYRIGTYRAERDRNATRERPAGFVRVMPYEVELPITKHLRLGDFLTRDGQETWPRYAAVSPRLLDKLELVLDLISKSLGDSGHVQMLLNVHSGFRTPVYNRTVRRAADDSRHQYGDAVDVAIDADGDGRITAKDVRIVAKAVEAVEQLYPDLVGGMGLYTSRRYSHRYVHIDARGKRARWRG
jgi:uncharacterized protein YcbK (DUF882 family)